MSVVFAETAESGDHIALIEAAEVADADAESANGELSGRVSSASGACRLQLCAEHTLSDAFELSEDGNSRDRCAGALPVVAAIGDP